MKKLILVSLLALAGLSIAAEVRSTSGAIVSIDVPPPDCAPECPLAH